MEDERHHKRFLLGQTEGRRPSQENIGNDCGLKYGKYPESTQLEVIENDGMRKWRRPDNDLSCTAIRRGGRSINVNDIR